jgi:hypothetical protein
MYCRNWRPREYDEIKATTGESENEGEVKRKRNEIKMRQNKNLKKEKKKENLSPEWWSMWHHRLFFCFLFFSGRLGESQLLSPLSLSAGFCTNDSAFAKSLSNFINDCQSFLSLSFGKRDVLDVYGALFSRSSFPTIHHRSTWNNWGSRCLDTSRVPSLIFYPFLILFFFFFSFFFICP